jgi:hypothetical protein
MTIHVIDIETTGTAPETDVIVEIASVGQQRELWCTPQLGRTTHRRNDVNIHPSVGEADQERHVTAQSDYVYIATGDTVIAIDRLTGREVWRTDSKPRWWQARIVIRMLLSHGKELYVATDVALYCLDRFTGARL